MGATWHKPGAVEMAAGGSELQTEISDYGFSLTVKEYGLRGVAVGINLSKEQAAVLAKALIDYMGDNIL